MPQAAGELRRRHAQKAHALQPFSSCRKYLQQRKNTREDALRWTRSYRDASHTQTTVQQQLNNQSAHCMANQNRRRWEGCNLFRVEVYQTSKGR